MKELEELLQKFSDEQLTLSELKELYHLLSVYKDQPDAGARINLTEASLAVEATITAEKSKQLLQKIHQRAGIDAARAKVIPLRHTIIKVSVAASVAGIIALGAFWFAGKNKIVTKELVRTDKASPPAPRSFVNTASIKEFVTLDDSSVVELTPKSAITYYKPFINNRRDISLKGTAFFKVAKDKNRPFTVYANGISTTALGTQFWVFANNLDSTRVRLLEGKVVIKAIKNQGALMADVYLAPGQNFSFDRLTSNVVVSKNGEENQTARASAANARILHSQSLVFNNEPLENVLQKIQQAYKKPLVFHKADVKGLVFTGTFLPTDDMQIVLSALCNMNDLSFENTGSGITISKRN